ncbi:MAG: PucR family transcriptional regulator [Pseudomonadota bacterium]
MTKVITRYFEDASRARTVRRELLAARLSPRIVRIYDTPKDLVAQLTGADVDPATAEAYQWRMEKGGAVVMVRAGHRPLGVAATSREIMARLGALDLGNLDEEVIIPEEGVGNPSLLSGHPHIFLREKDPERTNFHMADWPLPLINRRKPFRQTLFKDPHARMAAWPLGLTFRAKPRDEFAFPRHARMANIIFPLTIRRKPSDNFAFPRHARMANFPLPLTSRRKPYTGSAIGKHTRMANWPFPHLINGKTGQNALVPGGKRMANFPIPLLSDREPVDAFAFPRHARMANFPLSLISKREPFTGSIFPKHARMANLLLPLVVRREPGKGQGFSLSRLLGLPTIRRR